MADIVSKAVRSKMMSSIRSKNTQIEMVLRKKLWSSGFRYKLHCSHLPGKPDLVFPKYNTVIFINGCFWHGHACALFRLPKTRTDFWFSKISKNRKNDARNIFLLRNSNWRILTVWECILRGKKETEIDALVNQIINWLISGSDDLFLEGVQ